MTEPKLNITVEELAKFLYRHYEFETKGDYTQDGGYFVNCGRIARRMLAADALYDALQDVRVWLPDDENCTVAIREDIFNQVIAALAQADGKGER